VIRHRAARWLATAAAGLTLIGCQQGTEQAADPRPPDTVASVSPSTTSVAPTEVKALHASTPPATTVAPAPDPVPAEFATPWEPPTTTSTTTTTTEAPVIEQEPAVPARTVRPASADPKPPADTPAPPVAAAPQVDSAGAGNLTSRTNDVRASAGLAPLDRDGSLDALAIDWARELASSGKLRHSAIPKSIIGKPWTSAGENVGFGPSVDVVHDALVASAGHYANITGATYTRVGIGVAVDGAGQVWVVEVFAGA
jgi:uncharacterized protein YkwD